MPSLDPKLLDSPEARYATLERLVRDRVLAAAAKPGSTWLPATSGWRADLQETRNHCLAAPPDGKLDMDRYRQLVGAQGMTPGNVRERSA
jgi:peptidyl-prolyl cis-trans isomerase D